MDQASPRWSRAQTCVLAIGAVLTCVGIGGAQLADGAWVRVFDNVHWTSAYVTAALLALLGWRLAAPEHRASRLCFALGLSCYALGQIAWDVQVACGWNPFPGPSDALFVMLGPALMVGLYLETRANPVQEQRAILVVMAGVMAAILAYVLARYLPRCGDTSTFVAAVLTAYPTMLLGAAALSIVIALEQKLRVDALLALFVLSACANGVLWMEWNERTLENSLDDGGWYNAMFSLVALAQGAAVARWEPRRSASEAAERAACLAARSLPLLLVIGAAAAIVNKDRLPPIAGGAVTICMGVVVVAAAGHQALLLHERDRMLRAEARARELEQRVAQSQRLESLGTLAGGVAHDFNNILMAIYGHAQLAAQDTASKGAERASSTGRALVAIQLACERGRDVARRILAFARKDEGVREVVDLREITSESLRLLRAVLPTNVELHERGSDEGCWVECDPAQLQRVVLNLVTNGADAIGRRPGRVSVSVGRAHEPTAALELVVEDDGCGMDEATRLRAFEPFFSTKGVERGTGMGLSVVHGIVSSCGGSVSIESSLGRGTRVRALLPAWNGSHDLIPRAAPGLARPNASGAGREVLIVDDEEAVGIVLAHLATRLGWQPTVLREPSEALAAIERAPRRFAVLVTDHAMPHMSGVELAALARIAAPHLPIVLSSGNVGAAPELELFDAVLCKPYGLQQLDGVLTALATRAPIAAAAVAAA
ncbi:MAG: response regulator [Planctomycetota bacterium]|nr:MAG: response regulator [Planctomycetota bacterium]